MKTLLLLVGLLSCAVIGCTSYTSIQNIGNETYLVTRSNGELYRCSRNGISMRCAKIDDRKIGN